MKRFAFCLFIGFVLCYGCGKKEAKSSVKDNNVKDSTEHLVVDIRLSSLNTDEMYKSDVIDFYNDSIHNFLAGIRSELKNNLNEYKKEMSENSSEDNNFSFELYVNDTVYMRSPNLISTRIEVYTFEGGAHGSTCFYSFNYLPKEKRFINLKDQLLPYKKEFDKLLPQSFVNADDCFNEVPTFDNSTCVNESSSNYIFTYEQYVLGAGYCGSATVEVEKKKVIGD